ncbi:MAG: hypothetical protein P794_04145 [Epsilonproteobacteria bacterium (ex Lamellibrachia satsuma)]|nr:MAG: hypothetical protein P794_04145 [Epsilonproteobacteria bacterium (ex Lamellibrachia satsuma)]
MKTFRPAFTIIEILVSVIILSGSIVYVLKIHSQNHEQIVYISERNKLSLQDSLFLTDNVYKYHRERKAAYEVLQKYFKIKDLKSREILKKTSREFFIPEPVKIIPPDETGGFSALLDEIKMKDKYSSYYFHIKLQ